jgi:hypothetical protein
MSPTDLIALKLRYSHIIVQPTLVAMPTAAASMVSVACGIFFFIKKNENTIVNVDLLLFFDSNFTYGIVG